VKLIDSGLIHIQYFVHSRWINSAWVCVAW